MSYKIRKSHERKYFDHGWLKTYHTFSFASYYDPEFMGFRNLRVINEDRVAPDTGFPLHQHSNMEIISFILEGELAHKDSMGNETIIHANEIQTMSAGTGIKHSEYNPSHTQEVHFLQIWIIPDENGIKPRYQQKKLPLIKNDWVLIASKKDSELSLKINQDVNLYMLSLENEKQASQNVLSNRYGWLQVIEGKLQLNEDLIQTGDGASILSNTQINLTALTPSKVLFFDLN